MGRGHYIQSRWENEKGNYERGGMKDKKTIRIILSIPIQNICWGN